MIMEFAHIRFLIGVITLWRFGLAGNARMFYMDMHICQLGVFGY